MPVATAPVALETTEEAPEAAEPATADAPDDADPATTEAPLAPAEAALLAEAG